MDKTVLPALAMLAAGAAAFGIVIAGNARAQPEPRKPMLLAQAPQDLAARRKQFCQDQYAHQVGTLAYLEARLNLTPAQHKLFEPWKSLKLTVAKRTQVQCTTDPMADRSDNALPSPLAAMASEEALLKQRLADLQAERPLLGPLYNALDADQKSTLLHPAMPIAMVQAAPHPASVPAPFAGGAGQ